MKAMIFSAGLGTRFKPWTDKHPKALAIVNGKSLLQRNIEYLQSFGIKDVIVNVHHFANQIEKAIEKNNGWGSNIIISDERNEVLETGGGLLKAKDLFTPGEKFITCNVDILTSLDVFDSFLQRVFPIKKELSQGNNIVYRVWMNIPRSIFGILIFSFSSHLLKLVTRQPVVPLKFNLFLNTENIVPTVASKRSEMKNG